MSTLAPSNPNRPSDPVVEAKARGSVIAERGAKTRRRRRRKKEHQARAPPDTEVDAYSIPAFCRRHGGMSEAFFHKLCRLGQGPMTMKVGARTMVSAEAAAAWRRAREIATSTPNI